MPSTRWDRGAGRRALRALVAIALALPSCAAGGVLLFWAALSATPAGWRGEPGGFLPHYPQAFTGETTPVEHTIRGRTFAIPKAYLPYVRDHRPTSKEVDALTVIYAKWPDLAPYREDPLDEEGLLSDAAYDQKVKIALTSITFDRPVSSHFEFEPTGPCTVDAPTGFTVCPWLESRLWKVTDGSARIGMLCTLPSKLSGRSYCSASVPLVQNVSLNVHFSAVHRDEMRSLLSRTVDLVCRWFRPDPDNQPLTFNYCKEPIYAADTPE
ncbi:MAG: hypothetical protein RIB45_01485 [Marivibrio sp.]|uniref:hypothetical protein n=1 Tax=Marivibrio sp. TaxID=2039719 RepID=UPI0032ED7F3E